MRRHALLAICLVAVAACGDPMGTPGRKGARLTVVTPPPSRPALNLPTAPPTAAQKIDFYLDLLEGGGGEELTWAYAQLSRAGAEATAPLAARLSASIGEAAAENYARAFAEGVPGREATPALSRAAAEGDGHLRIAVAAALGRIGDPATVPVLLDLVGAGPDPVGFAALDALRGIGGEVTTRGLLGRFPDRMSPGVAAYAVGVLGATLDREALSGFLRGARRLEEPRIAISAARETLRRGSDAERDEAAEMLASRYLDGDLREAALDALAEGGHPRALPALLSLARAADLGASVFGIGNLSAYKQKEAREALWEFARGKDEERRREAFHALVRGGDPDALPAVRGMLGSPAGNDRLLAALILGAAKDPGALGDLVAATEREEDLAIRLKLANALSLLGLPECSPALARLLVSEPERDPPVAVIANQAGGMLGHLRTLAPEALETLTKAVSDGRESVRMNAALVLGRPGLPPEATRGVGALLGDESVHVRRAAAAAYPLMDGAEPDALHTAYRREGDARLAREMERGIRRILHRW